MLKRIVNLFTSLKLTVTCLTFGMLLIFVGTLAQVDEGLYNAQARYFKSWLIWAPTLLGHKVPIVLPGGYLLGGVLLVNLLAAHAQRFTLSKKKIGIFMVHSGLILLLLGQLLTDVLSIESAMRIPPGEPVNYSQDFHANELVVIDTSPASNDEVVSIPESLAAKQSEIRHEKLPVVLRVKNYWANADWVKGPANGAVATTANQGTGQGVYVLPRPPVLTMEERNLPSAEVEVMTPQGGSLGTWLLSSQPWVPSSPFAAKQTFTHANKVYQLALRFTRHYKPYTITLQKFTHEKYKGTDIPKNFSSRIRLQNPATGEDQEHLIFMNEPLRYAGETFYQGSFEKGDIVSILQVVHNPGWLTPYFACVLMALGLIVQFMSHLIGFAKKRRTA